MLTLTSLFTPTLLWALEVWLLPGLPPSDTDSSPPATDAVDTSDTARGALTLTLSTDTDTPPPSTDTDTALLTTVDTPLPSWPGLPRVSTDTTSARGALRLTLTTDTDTLSISVSTTCTV